VTAFDPVWFTAEGKALEAERCSCQREVEHAVQSHTCQEGLTCFH